MKEQSTTVPLHSAVVSDRGLSEKRPLNEDSFLSDTQRRIFAVADGVGGAQAGEVASQTAMEVLDEAFRHQEHNADIEDLMEVAIQRANASIHRMSQEHPKLSMMATTVVALHLDGHMATIGHVGDSRLYRLTPDGQLHRETRDHSVVEEEVRAGRMTQEQAANHPSRNVISRALGAEEDVEVDLKTIEVEDGTAFLLCSDGITRHIPDDEIREILAAEHDLDAACAEMKKRCFERGAEDNLTAVVVRVGEALERTLTPEDEVDRASARPVLAATLPGDAGSTPQPVEAPAAAAEAPSASSLARAAGGPDETVEEAISVAEAPAVETPTVVVPTAARRRSGAARAFLLLLLFGALGAGAFYGGTYYQKRQTDMAAPRADTSTTVAQPTPADPDIEFEKRRREVDKAPAKMASQMAGENNGKPLESGDPQFLYLYGRALMLTGKPLEANDAFKKAIEKIRERPARDPLKVEIKLAWAAAALKTGNWSTAQAAAKEIDEVIELENKAGAGGPLPGGAPVVGASSAANKSPASP